MIHFPIIDLYVYYTGEKELPKEIFREFSPFRVHSRKQFLQAFQRDP
jgi:hypothetical protein